MSFYVHIAPSLLIRNVWQETCVFIFIELTALTYGKGVTVSKFNVPCLLGLPCAFERTGHGCWIVVIGVRLSIPVA